MKKLMASAAVAATIAAGGIAVATISPIGVAGAGPSIQAEALPHDGQRIHRVLRGVVTTSAETIGISPKELIASYRGGQSIAEQAQANDVEVQAVEAALTAKATAAIDAALERGVIDSEQAARLTERLPSAIDRVVNHHRGDRRAG